MSARGAMGRRIAPRSRAGRRWVLVSAGAALLVACSSRGTPGALHTASERDTSSAAPPGSHTAPTGAVSDPPRRLDDFESITPWQAEASDGVRAAVRSVTGVEGQALELSFDFQGNAGYAIARRELPLELPANFTLSFDLRGEALPNDFQVKLVDASGDNVWWFRRTNVQFPTRFERWDVKKRQFEFAWGPTTDRSLTRAARLEFVIAAGQGGGRGFVAIDRLELRPRPAPPAVPPTPEARASTESPGSPPALAVDGQPTTAWTSAPGRARQTFEVDLGALREFGGLLLRWKPGAHASHYDVLLSEDGARFHRVRRVSGGDGGRDAILLPESEARFVRLDLQRGPAAVYSLAELEVKDLEFGATPNAALATLARESRRGLYPRAFVGEQPYWTLLGLDAATESALVSEDGAIEIGRGGFSVEPFVIEGGQLRTWADVSVEQRLEDGYLPMPIVTWSTPAWRLHIAPFVTGSARAPELVARYELENLTDRPLRPALVLAVRPLQVNPPTQTLNLPGGVSPIHALAWDGASLWVNERPALLLLDAPSHVALYDFDGGGFPFRPAPRSGKAPGTRRDPTGLGSAAWVHELHVPARRRVSVAFTAPLADERGPPPLRRRAPATLDAERARVAAEWREKLNRVVLTAPPSGQELVDTVRSCLAQILMSRDGAMLKPGTRSYARSWIRDGAMMSESLVRLGHAGVAADYLAWYAPYQFDNGKVPCCVDARGADPVPEHDSAGEFIFLAAEVYRFTGDRERLRRIWPAVEAAAGYMESLRQSERTSENTSPERRALFGLMPPSISHEGYSEKPAYSYWDNFWALIGYQDAVAIAESLGERAARERLARQRDEFRRDLYASLRASMAQHRIPFIPGAADRGDFDPTSTTIALAPGREGRHLPKDALVATFERYYREFLERKSGARAWDVYTPYELRSVGTFVRLGWRDRAHELLDFFMRDRRPRAWNQWAEVVGRDPREPRFIGDMPHAWVASDYIRSVLDLFAYAHPLEGSIVLAAGIPASWWESGGVRVRDLRTPFGALSYSIERDGSAIVVDVGGSVRPREIVLAAPWEVPPGAVTLNGKARSWKAGELHFRELPAHIRIDLPAGERADTQPSRKPIPTKTPQ